MLRVKKFLSGIRHSVKTLASDLLCTSRHALFRTSGGVVRLFKTHNVRLKSVSFITTTAHLFTESNGEIQEDEFSHLSERPVIIHVSPNVYQKAMPFCFLFKA